MQPRGFASPEASVIRERERDRRVRYAGAGLGLPWEQPCRRIREDGYDLWGLSLSLSLPPFALWFKKRDVGFLVSLIYEAETLRNDRSEYWAF